MARRIGWWTLAGLMVAGAWVLFTTTAIYPQIASENALRAAVEITAPASLLRRYPIKFYEFILLNACAYALVGLGAELLRRAPRTAHF